MDQLQLSELALLLMLRPFLPEITFFCLFGQKSHHT